MAQSKRSWAAVIVVLGLALTACIPFGGSGRPAGDEGRVFFPTGFFRSAYDGHRWWLVTPDGRPFYSTGINHVTTDGNDTDRKTGVCPYCQAMAANYPSVGAWTDTTIRRFHAWGINTIGTWSDADRFATRMPYTFLLNMAGTNDWFSPAFASRAASIAASTVAARRDDPNLIGWVLDSELRWGPDWRASTQLLYDYLALPPGSPGRVVADRYVGNPRGFLRVLATRYFRVTAGAIHAQDPRHLILGVKMITQLTPPEVLEAARPYVDVFSVDDYALIPGLEDQIQHTWPMYLPHDPTLSSLYRIVQRPLLVMEYSFRAADAGVPNSYPPIFPTYDTQNDRANAFAGYVHRIYSVPWFVGDHWFEYVDEPAGGRFDGEDSNFGLVSSADVPWQTLVDRMIVVHATAPDRVGRLERPCWSWQRTGPGKRVRCSDPLPSPHG